VSGRDTKDNVRKIKEAANSEGAISKADVENTEVDESMDVKMTNVSANAQLISADNTAVLKGDEERKGSATENEKNITMQSEDAKDDTSPGTPDQSISMETLSPSSAVITAGNSSKKESDTLGKENGISGDESNVKAEKDESGGNIEASAASNSNQSGEKKSLTSPMTTQNSPGTKAKTNGTSYATHSERGETLKSKLSMEERSGKFAAMAKKRGISGEEKNETDVKKAKEKSKKGKSGDAAPAIYVLDSKGRRVKVIDDDAEEMDCEFLNNRQAFLNLCQGNHYQFDHLRRAKHSSMMVLWHLHNRDAPKFVQQCTTCSREILQGYRFHCPICADFDQCQDCVQNPNIPRHPHQLKPIAVAGQQTELTEAQRKERQRSIQLHMTLLQHAATCNSPKCPSANCTKMKGLLKHGAQCKVKAAGGCNVCKRIWALLQIHARQCKASQCPVPNCMAIRERVRQLKKQQQAMDDRRREEMNRVYRGAR